MPNNLITLILIAGEMGADSDAGCIRTGSFEQLLRRKSLITASFKAICVYFLVVVIEERNLHIGALRRN